MASDSINLDSSKTSQALVMMPVFNDWDACWLLLDQLDATLATHGLTVDVLLVDDGSVERSPTPSHPYTSLRSVEVLELKRNVGHQRAICLGLCYVDANLDVDVVVVMDADGEDAPADVPRLLEKFELRDRREIVFAERRKRSENFVFRVCYHIYRYLHWVLTGYKVRVGNFSVVPQHALRQLVLLPSLWSHYAAAVFSSKQAYTTLPTHRSKRLDGSSKMNFVALVTHGLTAISVFAERVGVRLLLATLLVASTLMCGIAVVLGIRFLTDWAIPGWATFACGLLAVIFCQCLIGALLFSFMVLSSRNHLDFLPARDFHFFISQQRILSASPSVSPSTKPATAKTSAVVGG